MKTGFIKAQWLALLRKLVQMIKLPRLYNLSNSLLLSSLIQFPEGSCADGVVSMIECHILCILSAEGNGKHHVQQIFSCGEKGGDGQLVGFFMRHKQLHIFCACFVYIGKNTPFSCENKQKNNLQF